ncbi:MAG: hypothetical protein DBY08_05710 [Clostridiales bacterium]|nr:MAG: hypothetical protein DBY08_05710 [Clostridiales bacterium]
MKRLLGKSAVIIYILSTVCFCMAYVNNPNKTEDTSSGRNVSATDLGVMCINASYPSMGIELADSRDNEIPQEEITDLKKDESAEIDNQQPDVSSGEPEVLIVHTHATESYLPQSGGNFHSKDEENTVRDVGNVLAQTLEKQGIAVVHDKTLHDYPSYNNSYGRSYATTQELLEKYPSVKCVIDLHRDAIAAETPAATVSVGGRTCAKYSYVVSTGTVTYQSNLNFVKTLNEIAKSRYNGFTGKVIERSYKYNQDLSSQYILLEIGYNRNQIEDCRNTADIIGNVLGEALKNQR